MANAEELIKRMEDAANKGAKEGAMEVAQQKVKGNKFIAKIIVIVLIIAVVLGGVWYIKSSFDKRWEGLYEQFGIEDPADWHDMILDNRGIFGYTAADFAPVIIKDAQKKSKLIVYEAQLTDAIALTNTGLLNWRVFTKTKVITYNGTAQYYVDLSKINEDCFVVDNDNRIVTIFIPQPELDTINIPSDKIEFGDTEKGLLAWGDYEMTPEEMYDVETTAREKMQQKLEELNEKENAKKFAQMAIWQIYQPLVSKVDSEYKLVIDFR